MYVNKYPITTHDESLKPFKSSDVAKRDVDMMVVSSREKKKPSKILNKRMKVSTQIQLIRHCRLHLCYENPPGH